MRKRTHAREYALQILYQLEMNPVPVEEMMGSFWEENAESLKDVRRFTEMLVRGSLERREEIDATILKATENWQLDRMAVIDRSILRCATYELLYVEDIPRKVTLNEAVNLAKKFSQEESGKFVNGVLDKINHSEKSRTATGHEKPLS